MRHIDEIIVDIDKVAAKAKELQQRLLDSVSPERQAEIQAEILRERGLEEGGEDEQN